MCFGVSYAPNANENTPLYSPQDAYTAVSETQKPADGKTASQLDPMSTNTSGATQPAPAAPSSGGTGLTVGM